MFEKEFFDESLNKNCKLLIVKDNITEKYFQDFLNRYLNKNIKRIISFDLEFNTPPKSTNQRKIAIFQLCFYLKKYNLIIFFNPLLVSDQTNNLMHSILTNNKIIKMGHGTDSLDIPAIYNYLNSVEKCIKFTINLYDTRFLCEYLNIITDNKLCNIYYLLEKFNVITEKQKNWLFENETKLGNFWDKVIDITNLSSELRDYSMYDALYIKKLLISMKNNINNKHIFFLLNELTRLVFLLKRNIFIIDNITYLNIAFLSNKTKMYDNFLIEYNKYLQNLDNKIVNLFNIGYFKNIIMKIFQLKYYLNIAKKYKIYKSKILTVSNNEIHELNNQWINLYKNLIFFPKFIKLLDNFLIE